MPRLKKWKKIRMAAKLINSEIKEDIDMLQRGRGLELLVCIGKAMGKEKFRPYLSNAIEIGKIMLTIQHSSAAPIKSLRVKFTYPIQI